MCVHNTQIHVYVFTHTIHTFPSVISSSTSAPQAQRLEEIMLADVVVVVVGLCSGEKSGCCGCSGNSRSRRSSGKAVVVGVAVMVE